MTSSLTLFSVVEDVVGGSFEASLDVLIEVVVVDVEGVVPIVVVVVDTVVTSSGFVCRQRPLRKTCPFPVQ